MHVNCDAVEDVSLRNAVCGWRQVHQTNVKYTLYLRGSKVTCTYILQVELKLLLVGFKLTGQLVALVVEGQQTLQEGQQLEGDDRNV